MHPPQIDPVHAGFGAWSRNTRRSRGGHEEKPPIVIVSVQNAAARRTCLLGSIDSRTQSAPARVRIVYLD